MSFLQLQIYRIVEPCDYFDPNQVLKKLELQFPGIQINKIDHMDTAVKNAEERSKDQQSDPIVKRLKQLSEEYGPSYTFKIPVDSNIVYGQVRKVNIHFNIEEIEQGHPIFPRLVNFLKSFKIGKVELLEEGNNSTQFPS